MQSDKELNDLLDFSAVGTKKKKASGQLFKIKDVVS